MERQQQQQIARVYPLKSSSAALSVSKPIPAYDEQTGELVIYADARLDDSTAAFAYASLLQAFPKMTDMMANLIIERMIANGFSNSRAVDAINQVIDTYDGWDKLPNVANFIQFDRRVKLMTAGELTTAANEGKARWDDYAIVRIEGVSACRSAGDKPVLFVKRTDAERFGIVTREPKQHGKDWPD